jgi:hypothetical protein
MVVDLSIARAKRAVRRVKTGGKFVHAALAAA